MLKGHHRSLLVLRKEMHFKLHTEINVYFPNYCKQTYVIPDTNAVLLYVS